MTPGLTVAAQRNFCAAPRTGLIQCWGSGRRQPAGIAGIERASWTSMATGWRTCAVNTGHELWCWEDDDGAPHRVAPERSWATVGVGSHVCALTTGGDMWCWGANETGQLGDGTLETRAAPVAVNADLRWRTVVAEGRRTCGLTDAGALWCWGSGVSGLAGDGDVPLDSLAWPEPLRVGAGTDWAQVAAGDYTCAIRTDRTLSCWGQEITGEDLAQPGDEATVTFPAGARWRSISVDGPSACGVLVDASLWCTGYVGKMYHEPAQRVGAGATWSAVDVDGDRSCGRRTDATIWCWGLPPGETQATPIYSYEPEPATGCVVPVWCWTGAGRGRPLTVDADGGTVCAVTTAHGLWCGESRIAGSWVDVSAGAQHVCGIQRDASLWCWGAAGQGRLGDAVAADRPAPMRVRTAARWIAVSAGTTHTCGIQSDHSLWCWGSNAERQLGATFPVRRRVPVPAGTGTSQFPGRPVR
ncbi:hypothetical protein [Actinoplanes philippinensis]|uniref:hypothetical protein n=1 Tax=Actinoplanes philippinensis TaxID=35752 RepID=UPI0033F77D23